MYEGKLFGAGEPFEGAFAAHGRGSGFKRLIIGQGDRQTAPGIFGARACVMGGKALIKVVRIARIEGAVRTAQKISVIHQ